MECFNCLKQCPCQIAAKTNTGILYFCTEACEDAYIKEDIRIRVQKRAKTLIEQLNQIKKTFSPYQNHPFTKMTCAEMFLCNSIATGKSREVLNHLYKIFCDTQLDGMEHMSEKCKEGTYLVYCDIAKREHEKYQVFIDLC